MVPDGGTADATADANMMHKHLFCPSRLTTKSIPYNRPLNCLHAKHWQSARCIIYCRRTMIEVLLESCLQAATQTIIPIAYKALDCRPSSHSKLPEITPPVSYPTTFTSHTKMIDDNSSLTTMLLMACAIFLKTNRRYWRANGDKIGSECTAHTTTGTGMMHKQTKQHMQKQ